MNYDFLYSLLKDKKVCIHNIGYNGYYEKLHLKEPMDLGAYIIDNKDKYLGNGAIYIRGYSSRNQHIEFSVNGVEQRVDLSLDERCYRAEFEDLNNDYDYKFFLKINETQVLFFSIPPEGYIGEENFTLKLVYAFTLGDYYFVRFAVEDLGKDYVVSSTVIYDFDANIVGCLCDSPNIPWLTVEANNELNTASIVSKYTSILGMSKY